MNDHPRFSIIVPACNGGSYLPACITSILEQDYTDYELIVSDDHSNDGSVAYLQSVAHSCFRWVVPPEGLSMAEHWEWAAEQARGEWLIFVGQDDGLQPYFFTWAERLVQEADQRSLRTIMSRRAYYFWPGCASVYGDISVSWTASPRISVRCSAWNATTAMLGFTQYFDLPEMYTTSLFRRDLLEQARQLQQGRLFVAHPQDANLAALAVSLESRYLWSELPLGWVGSSPKSAGLAIVFNNGEDEKDSESLLRLKDEYLAKVKKSRIDYHPNAGDFAFANLSLYFWQAMLQTSALRSAWVNALLRSRLFTVWVFAGVLLEVRQTASTVQRLEQLQTILAVNRLPFWVVTFCAIPLSGWGALFRGYRRCCAALTKRLFAYGECHCEAADQVALSEASRRVFAIVGEKKWLV